jgi:hypothetical protein
LQQVCRSQGKDLGCLKPCSWMPNDEVSGSYYSDISHIGEPRQFCYEIPLINVNRISRTFGKTENLKIITMKKVVVLIGAGSIGQVITRRVSAGKHVLLADLRQENADAAAKTLSDAGFEVTTATVDVSLFMPPVSLQDLLRLPFLQPTWVKDSLHAYQLAKRGNALRVMAEAVRWGKRGARINTISPGIIITPLANDELKGPRGDGYRCMLEISAAGRAGTPDEVGNIAALLMGPDGAFIIGAHSGSPILFAFQAFYGAGKCRFDGLQDD